MSALPEWLAGVQRAPSAHNTQPWRLGLELDGRVVVRWDPARTLPAADPTDRDLYLALGAAVESLRLRAAAAGVALAFTPAPDGVARTVGELAPVRAPIDPADVHLAGYLEQRQTARTAHLRRPIPPDVLATLQAEAARADCRLHTATGRPAVRQLARLARRATAAQFADAALHAELWRWLRLDPRAPAYWRDGLTADCLELRGAALTLARLTLPPPRMRRLVRLGVHHLLALDTAQVVARSAALCLLTGPAARRADLVRTGGALLRIWLRAAAAGLSAHPVSAVLDYPATVAPALAVFGAGDASPAALFRLGASPPAARAPRLPLAEVIETQ